MRQPGSFLCLLVLACYSSGCDGFVLFVSSGPLPPANASPVSPPPPRPVLVGDIVQSTFVLPEVSFDLRAPANGTLFVSLSWDRRHGDIDFTFVSVVFASQATTTASSGATSTIGTLRVSRGQSYRIAVRGEQGPVPFTLTTAMQ